MKTQINEETILDKLYVCQADLHIWSGQVKTDAVKDIILGAGGRMPSDKVARPGRKFVIDPRAIKGFNGVRTSVRRDLERLGVPFMGGWAIPLSRKDELDRSLQNAVDKFEELKANLIRNYDQYVQDWINENPQDADVIWRGKLDVNDVEQRLSVAIKRFQITGTSAEDNRVLEEEAKELGNNLLSEISAQAENIYQTNFAGKERVGCTVSLTLKGIRDKLDGLSFLNKKFRPIVSMLDNIIAGCTTFREGRFLTAPFLYEVVAALLILSDQKKLEQMMQGLLTVSSLGTQLAPTVEDPESEPDLIQDPIPEEPKSDLPSIGDTGATQTPASEEVFSEDDKFDFGPVTDEDDLLNEEDVQTPPESVLSPADSTPPESVSTTDETPKLEQPIGDQPEQTEPEEDDFQGFF